jgi:hypothetical protein
MEANVDSDYNDFCRRDSEHFVTRKCQLKQSVVKIRLIRAQRFYLTVWEPKWAILRASSSLFLHLNVLILLDDCYLGIARACCLIGTLARALMAVDSASDAVLVAYAASCVTIACTAAVYPLPLT